MDRLILLVWLSFKRRKLYPSNLCLNIDLDSRYLIVDYERKNFSIYQNIQDPSLTPQIATIPPLSATTSSKLSNMKHIITGVVTSVIFIFLLTLGLILYLRRKRKTKKKQEHNQEIKPLGDDRYAKPEMEGTGKLLGGVDGASVPTAEANSDTRAQLQDDPGVSTVSINCSAELEGDMQCTELVGDVAAAEIGQGKDIIQLKTS